MTGLADRLAGLSVSQRALLAEKLASRLDALERAQREPIAIVGMACRFPGDARSPQHYWELIRSGGSGITEVPSERWDVDRYYDPRPSAPGKTYARWGGFIGPVDGFDPRFFGIAPREASFMDPQQRLALEVTWEALENAGATREDLAGSSTGVFMGLCAADYLRLQAFDPESIDAHSATGVANNLLTGRISYWLDLKGPSLTLDTACSSSLVAIHVACQSLRAGECRTALSGGVNLMLSPEPTIAHSKIRLLSQDGCCKVFDARADGIVRGEGCGVVVLKLLSDALSQGDRILALIRGTAVNHDGRSNGLTAPSGGAQQDLLRQALASAGVSPSDVGYLEAHGTGTALGDPIEVESLAAVLGRRGPSRAPCVLGSVKANIGHLEGAAGVAGLIKAVLVLRSALFPPQIHFERLNPEIDLAGTSFVIPTSSRPWPPDAGPRIAGVSSFGWSGTNAHVVLEEPPQPSQETVARRTESPEAPQIVPLSARSDDALRGLLRRYAALLQGPTRSRLCDLAYSASVRRSHFERRVSLVVCTVEELAGEIESLLQCSRALAPAIDLRRRRSVAFVFPEPSPVDVERSRTLLDAEPRFREAITACDAASRAGDGTSLLAALKAGHPPAPTAPERHDLLGFAVQWALAQLWRARGIEPDAVIGHGVGELAAACCAGGISLEQAVRLLRRDEGAPEPEPARSNPRIPFFSAAAKGAAEGADAFGFRPDAAADWAGAWQKLLTRGYCSFVALGGAATAGHAFEQVRRGETSSGALWVGGLDLDPDPRRGLLIALGRLYAAGHRIAWSSLHASDCAFVDLPHHPFLRDRYWLDTGRRAGRDASGTGAPAES